MTAINDDEIESFAELNGHPASIRSAGTDLDVLRHDFALVAERLKRIPQQSRSLEFLDSALHAAGSIVSAGSIDDLTFTRLAGDLDVPRSSLYQYFKSRDDLLLALVMRDMARMDEQVTNDLLSLPRWDIDIFIRTAIHAFLKVQMESPAFVEIYLRGRGKQLIRNYGRVHSADVAVLLHALMVGEGMVVPETPVGVAELCMEVGDRALQMAFATSDEPDMAMVENGISMVSAYIRTLATPAGLAGIDRVV